APPLKASREPGGDRGFSSWITSLHGNTSILPFVAPLNGPCPGRLTAIGDALVSRVCHARISPGPNPTMIVPGGIMKLPRRAACLLCAAGATILLSSCAQKPEKKAEAFVATYTKEYQRLTYDVNKAEWAVNTRIVEGDTMTAYKDRMAKEAYAQFAGSTENIETTKRFL